jgi:glycosyltransferase involved in cell wall biosynthesis
MQQTDKTIPRITISLPCYLRPQRTKRAIESILAQTIDGWELLITGDGCPLFDNPEFSEWISEITKDQYYNNNNSIICKNNKEHSGYWGTEIRNQHIKSASGEWFMFMGSDDVLLPTHLSNVLSIVENTDLDFAYFDTYVEPYESKREAKLEFGSIGHSELIIRTEFLQKMPPHEKRYGHDFSLIENMVASTSKYQKGMNPNLTYIVKSVPIHCENGID